MNDNRYYYVYQLIDPRSSLPFYVGKGCGYRHTHHVAEAHRPPILWSNTIKCLRILAIERSGYKVHIIKSGIKLSNSEAHELEQQLINKYGCIVDNTGILTNVQRHSTCTHHNTAPTPKRQVQQFATTGDLIHVYPSASAAAHDIGTRVSNILACCGGKTKHAKGYIWRWEGDTDTSCVGSDYHKQRRRPVVQKSKGGETIATFSSIKEASISTGVNHANICVCCNNGVQKTAGGFRWEYLEYQ